MTFWEVAGRLDIAYGIMNDQLSNVASKISYL